MAAADQPTEEIGVISNNNPFLVLAVTIRQIRL